MEEEARRTYVLTIRATPGQYEKLRKLAGQYNTSMNRYLLDAALNMRLQAPAAEGHMAAFACQREGD